MKTSATHMVLLTGGFLDSPAAKTAINLIRYRPEKVVAVLDVAHAGKTCQDLLGMGGAIPVVDSLDQAPQADCLVIGIAPPGGKLPPEMRAIVLEAIQRKINVISGLHDFLSFDSEITALAQLHGVEVVDLRHNTERDVAHRQHIQERCLRILTVGQDCNVGKMVVSLELTRYLHQAGYDAKFVATGQTGILIEGDGCPVDAVVGDFVNGAVERLILTHQHHQILLIEGQGSLVHPRYSPVTLGLLHGSVPDALILCYEMGRQRVGGMDHVPLPGLASLVGLYESMSQVVHPCRVIGVAMNSRRFTAEQADKERIRVQGELGLPVSDVIRHGPEALARAVLAHKTAIGK